MITSTRKILNLREEATQLRIKEVCEKYSAHVFPKLRVADVLKIDSSGLSDEEYGYSMRAHFDFVVTDNQHNPLFAVEFDGPLHKTQAQQHRDKLKNQVCDRLFFPLLRINDRYLSKKYRSLDLLSWFIEVWFFREAFFQAQDSGSIPIDEPFDPFSIMGLPDRKERFPLWLSAEIRIKIQQLNKAKKCYDFVPSVWVGVDNSGNYHGITWLMVTENAGVLARSGIRAQRFPVIESELLSELLVFQLYEELENVFRGSSVLVPKTRISANVQEYKSQYKLRSYSGIGRETPS